jgi:hypothetical protein
MSEPFHGVLPALITPFTYDSEAIDTDALAAIVNRLIAAGVGGLVPGGSTGEFTTLTHAERRRRVKAAADRVPVIAGTGALSTRAVGPALAALSVPGEPELPGRDQGRLSPRRGCHRARRPTAPAADDAALSDLTGLIDQVTPAVVRGGA